MKLNPYLTFNGQCRVAFEFYAQALNGTDLVLMTHGDTPMVEEIPSEMHDKIIHARLNVGDSVLMGADAPPQYYREPQGMHISLNIDDPSEAERVFAALAHLGQITMPIEETFWARKFGMLIDQFGTPWMINCENHG